MYQLLTSRKFERKIKNFNEANLHSIKETIRLLSKNPFDLQLKTHKLKGKLKEFYSCSCGKDCRIIFRLLKENNPIIIVLVEIGKHDEVY